MLLFVMIVRYILLISMLVDLVSCDRDRRAPIYPPPVQRIINSFFIPSTTVSVDQDLGISEISTTRVLVAKEIVGLLEHDGWEVRQNANLIYAIYIDDNFKYEINIGIPDQSINIKVSSGMPR